MPHPTRSLPPANRHTRHARETTFAQNLARYTLLQMHLWMRSANARVQKYHIEPTRTVKRNLNTPPARIVGVSGGNRPTPPHKKCHVIRPTACFPNPDCWAIRLSGRHWLGRGQASPTLQESLFLPSPLLPIPALCIASFPYVFVVVLQLGLAEIIPSQPLFLTLCIPSVSCCQDARCLAPSVAGLCGVRMRRISRPCR